jgi:hypothetical protein
MNSLSAIDNEARLLVEKLVPYLPWQSEDVRDEYAAGEYIAAADGAIHDLGAIRVDLPEELLKAIESLIASVELEEDPYAARFLDRMKTGLQQMTQRRSLIRHQRTA